MRNSGSQHPTQANAEYQQPQGTRSLEAPAGGEKGEPLEDSPSQAWLGGFAIERFPERLPAFRQQHGRGLAERPPAQHLLNATRFIEGRPAMRAGTPMGLQGRTLFG
jgi:hypothetical protein